MTRLFASVVSLVVFHTAPAVADPALMTSGIETTQTTIAVVAETPVEANPKVIYATVTGYSSTPDQTDDTPEIMASGKRVYDGAIACPRKYLFGTRVKINGKEYVCEDRMHIRFDDRFDIWFVHRTDAKHFGIRELPVEILSPTELAINL